MNYKMFIRHSGRSRIQMQIQNKTTKRKRNRQYRTDEQTRRESTNTNYKKFKTTHYSNRRPNQSKREQVASFYLRSHCHQHQIWALVHSQYGSVSYIQTVTKSYLFAALRNFHRWNSLINSNNNLPQKYCTSLTDSKRLYPNNLRKQSFQHTPRSLILATGRFRAPMQ